MALGSNNPFPKVKVVEQASVATPSAGAQHLFIDSVDHHLKRKNSGGTIVDLESASSLALDDLTDVDVPSPTNGDVLTYQAGSPAGWVAAAPPSGSSSTRAITFAIDGGGVALTTGVKADVYVPYACTITGVTMLADASGSVVVDIWKDTYANYPPVVGDSITASAKPTITTATKSQDNTLTGWTTSVSAGNTLRFNIDSASTITRLALTLTVTV